MVPLGLPVKQFKPGGGGSVQKHPHMGVSPFEHTLWVWFERNRKDRHTHTHTHPYGFVSFSGTQKARLIRCVWRLSPYLAFGCVSPRLLYWEIQRFEKSDRCKAIESEMAGGDIFVGTKIGGCGQFHGDLSQTIVISLLEGM